MSERLTAQMQFLQEVDRLKSIERSNVLLDHSRHENSGEHSWHAALFALVLSDDAPKGCDVNRSIQMLLVHDIVEIDAGDHPVDQGHDAQEIARKEAAAAKRIFGILPKDQCDQITALWCEFEAGTTPDAIYAKRIDHLQPILQVLMAPSFYPGHREIAAHTLRVGRAKRLAHDWPTANAFCEGLLSGAPANKNVLTQKLGFLAEADQLKSVTRASLLCDGSRYENSAEHSWHVMLWAMVLAEYAPQGCDVSRVITMLLLHDLVEIDAGDAPVFSDQAVAKQEAAELAAADRIFGLLPGDQGPAMRAIWDEFEAAQSPDALFGKALDRAAPPLQNIASGGGSWIEYEVTWSRFEARVAQKIRAGAPGIWDWLAPRARDMLKALPHNRP
ncbi:MAG: HD domain-containing protein [Pelagimonas sp.]|jgi:putative hydrolase of HD superfamily|nr:HD domain-containing protein [Pelagimonas sp.]